MRQLLSFLILFSLPAFSHAQYEEYESYQTFSDLDKYQRDYGLVLLPGAVYYSIQEANSVSGATVSDRKRNVLFYDVRMYYIFRGGFTFGLLYGGESQDINGGAPKTERSNIGLTFGYIKWGWTVLSTYLPYSIQTLSGTADVSEYSKGSGFQLDFAYHFRLGNHFSIGPQITYKNIQYKEAESATTSIDTTSSSTHSVVVPMISIMINLFRG